MILAVRKSHPRRAKGFTTVNAIPAHDERLDASGPNEAIPAGMQAAPPAMHARHSGAAKYWLTAHVGRSTGSARCRPHGLVEARLSVPERSKPCPAAG